MPRLRRGQATLLLGYCTNVEPTPDLAALERAIDGLWAHVRAAASPEGPMGLGLWLPRPVAHALARTPGLARSLRDRLAARGLFCFTLNAFPYEHFHEATVKRAVYRPSWLEPARAAYTLDAAAALAALLPDDLAHGTLSTVPLAWGADLSAAGPAAEIACADALLDLAGALGRLEASTGKRVQVLVEPEPGCAVETTDGAIAWFERLLERASAAGGDAHAEVARRHLGVCFDCCHQAVMGERLPAALAALRAASVPVGKLHLSSALEGPIEALAPFAEPRYLHQTVLAEDAPTEPRGGGRTDAAPLVAAPAPRARADDLPEALADPAFAGRRVRTHFHVPIHPGALGARSATARCALTTTAALLGDALDEALRGPDLPHLEVETYTWPVLPGAPADRAAGIAAEMRHARGLLAARGFE